MQTTVSAIPGAEVSKLRYTPWPNLSYYLFLQIKFYWHTPMPVHMVSFMIKVEHHVVTEATYLPKPKLLKTCLLIKYSLSPALAFWFERRIFNVIFPQLSN